MGQACVAQALLYQPGLTMPDPLAFLLSVPASVSPAHPTPTAPLPQSLVLWKLVLTQMSLHYHPLSLLEKWPTEGSSRLLCSPDGVLTLEPLQSPRIPALL